MGKFSLLNIFNKLGSRRILGNILWLSLDKVIRIGIGFFILGWIARYLGPEKFGLWNFAIAFASLFSVFATLGIDEIVIKQIINQPEKINLLLGSAFIIRLIGATTGFFLCLFTAYIFDYSDPTTLSLIVLSAGGFIFQAFFVIDYYNQANLRSKYTVWALNLAFAITSVIKITMLLLEAPIIAFGAAGLIETALGSLFLMIFHLSFGIKRYNADSFLKWKFSYTLGSNLIKQGLPLLLASISIMIYMRIDQIMIKAMLGDREIGLYSAAVRISEIWYFIPMAIHTSVFPKIVEYKMLSEELYYKALQRYFTIMAWIGIAAGAFFTLFGKSIINLIFGPEYVSATLVLQIYIWSGVFTCLGVASSSWILAENLQILSFYRTFLGAVSNIALNLLLIPHLSISGAALATLISYSIAAFFFDILNKKTISIFRMKIEALFFPLKSLLIFISGNKKIGRKKY